ncbi:MAG: methyltransferase, TIGR04325 family [Betaproteobacteria bacterium]|nr:methyltransferase, TIGR04325 family [Betaproteobacteria bacterium]
MRIETFIHRAGSKLVKWPVFRQLDLWLFEREFRVREDVNLHRGVYSSFESAAESIPDTKPGSYDNEVSATMYQNRLAVVHSDYPALLWIERSIARGDRLFADLGGSIGIKYYAFSRATKFPDDLRWLTVDVPAVVRAGIDFAKSHDPSGRLRFSESYGDLSACDVLLVSGSAQYLPSPIASIVASLPEKPRRIVFNGTPLHDSWSYFTVNSIGNAFCPYRIESRESFVKAFDALGYSVTDQWKNNGKGLTIPGYPLHMVEAYSGFCFDL